MVHWVSGFGVLLHFFTFSRRLRFSQVEGLSISDDISKSLNIVELSLDPVVQFMEGVLVVLD
jgi:hypothetical protein